MMIGRKNHRIQSGLRDRVASNIYRYHRFKGGLVRLFVCGRVMKEDVKEAVLFAEEALVGQKDRAGVDYMVHVMTVVHMVNTPTEKIVAALHDVVEDSDVSVDEIENVFGPEVAHSVSLMTHSSEDSYYEYVQKISEDDVATEVKKADITHNMDVSRLESVTDEDVARVGKYWKSYQMLR